MNMGKLQTVKKVLGLSALLFISLQASYSQAAGLVLCGNANRTFSLDSSEGCVTSDGNLNPSDPVNMFGDTFEHIGGIDADHLTNALFGLNFDGAGGFGSKDVSGDWFIASGFWSTHSAAVLSFHVGQGNLANTPDSFAFLVTSQETSGEWLYNWISGSGGGFSNMHLWGVDKPPTGNEPPPTRVPEPSPVLLFALGLLGLAYTRKKSA